MAALFRDAMRLMRRSDPHTRKEGFRALLPHAGGQVEELITEFLHEHDDHGLRCWLLELIGEARSPLALPALVERLKRPERGIPDVALKGLRTSRLPAST
jgi:hypothetical protein